MPLMIVVQITTDNREPNRQYENPTPWFGTAPEALFQGFAHLQDVRLHVVSCSQRRMVASPEKLNHNTWFHSLHVPKLGWLRTGYQGCVRAVRRKIREIQPDIVHGQGTERECALSAICSGRPNVITIHGNMRILGALRGAKPFDYLWLAARLETFTIPRSDGIVCITDYTREAMSPLAKRTWVVPNAVDQGFLNIERLQPPAGELPLILVVGHIDARKNQNAFILALDSLARQSSFQLVFLGQVRAGDAYGDEFSRLVSARSWCRHRGFVDRETLRRYFQQASLLALPSIEDNCPMVVLEAMAAGVPVVAANVGGVPELIEDGRSGLLCDPLSGPHMRSCVQTVLAKPDVASRLAEEAKRRASARFHPRVIAERHLDIYREVLKSRS